MKSYMLLLLLASIMLLMLIHPLLCYPAPLRPDEMIHYDEGENLNPQGFHLGRNLAEPTEDPPVV